MSLIINALISFISIILLSITLVSAQDRLPCVNKTFTLVTHVISDNGQYPFSPALIATSIDDLNQLFEPICISFEICESNLIENHNYSTFDPTDEFEEIQTIYNRDEVINVYFASSISNPSSASALANNNSVVITEYNSLAAGIGLFFGLSHTFAGNGNELVDGSNCLITGDSICDTPADIFSFGDNFSNYVDSCVYIDTVQKNLSGAFYSPQINNIMSFFNVCLPQIFTDDQYTKMANSASSSTFW
ncbi:MAG: hypothetical protein HRT72_01600 [Flavobacteriales bacterium]|nr:hypothetical protein [Flavobacteriales bacterium]